MQDILERLNLINIELSELEEQENWMRVVRGNLERERTRLVEEINNG